MAEITRANSVRSLANALGVSTSRGHALSKEPWFPVRQADGWDVAACQKAVAANRRGETPSPAAAPPSPTATSSPPTSPVDAGDVGALAAGDDPIAVARAALKVASWHLATHAELGPESHPRSAEWLRNALEGVKRSLEELRRCEAGYLELAKERAQVVEVEVAKGVVAIAGRRFVASLDRLEVALASRIERWLFDAEFRALEPAERRRQVRAWAIEQTTAARSLEAEEIDRLVAEQLKEARS